MKDKIEKWLKNHGGFDSKTEFVREENNWHNYKVFVIDYYEDMGDIGSPIFILVKDKEIRFAKTEEINKLIDFLYKEID